MSKSLISVNIKLTNLIGAKIVPGKDGKKYVAIPLEDNPSIWANEKVASLNVAISECKNEKFNTTHLVVARVADYKVRKDMGEEARRAVEPILGNGKIIEFRDVVSSPTQGDTSSDMPDFGL